MLAELHVGPASDLDAAMKYLEEAFEISGETVQPAKLIHAVIREADVVQRTL